MRNGSSLGFGYAEEGLPLVVQHAESPGRRMKPCKVPAHEWLMRGEETTPQGKSGDQSSGTELSITRTLSPRTVIGIGTTDS